MPEALLRAVPDSFVDALVGGDRPDLDVALAREQHESYRTALVDAGYEVTVIEADEAHPDCPFIEDTAVVLGDTAVVTRPGAASRRGEVAPVADALRARYPVAAISDPATIDGGDVLVMGDRVFVGRTARTNAEGINQLSQISALLGFSLRPVIVNGVLHLKSAVLRLDDDTVLLSPSHIDPDAFGNYRVIPMAIGEESLASALVLADGRVVVPDNAPDTASSLEEAGYKVVPIDISQFQAADGGLTCLSLLV